MIRTLKIQHKDIYPDGEWRTIANESDEGKVDDDNIYYYMHDSVDLSLLRVGDVIELDEIFKIVEIET